MLESFERVISGANRGPKRASINVSPHPLWNGNRESFAKSSCLESFSRLTNPSDGLVYLNVTVVPRKRCESGCNVSSTNAEFNFETRSGTSLAERLCFKRVGRYFGLGVKRDFLESKLSELIKLCL